MFSFNSEMAAVAQARLDEEIARLVIKLSSLKTQKNSFALISRLPTPILARIFVYYARHDHYRPYTSCQLGFLKPRWTNVVFVCRHWRHVALTCPAPWGYLFVASPRWTETLVAQSLDSPLRVRVHFYTLKMALDFMAQVAMHTERLQECCLIFGLTRSDAARAFSVLSSWVVPLLRILKITIEPRGESLDSSKHKQAQAVNEHILFNGDTPMLRELELINCDMPWYSPTLGGLTTLQLSNLATSVQLTMAELRVLLDCSPDLVQLHLENALRSGASSSTCQDSKKLHLPSLARLLITAPFSEILALLSYVEIPLTAQVRLKCRQRTHPRADDFIPFCSFLSEWFGASTNKATSFIPVRSICIENVDEGLWKESLVMRFIFRTSENAVDLFTGRVDYERGAPLKVDFDSWPPLSKQRDDIIGNICQSVPLAHLKRITLDGCRLSSTVWADTFWHLQELRTIELINMGLSDLIETLSIPSRPPLPNTEGQEGQGPCQVFAPSLEEIVLDEIGFIDYMDGPDDIYPDKVQRLFGVLARRRQEAGRALERLKLFHCMFLHEGDVEYLSGVVGQVDQVRDEPDEDDD